MIDINELRQSLGAVQPEEVAELLDRLEAAEKERDELRAKIETAENDAAHQKALAASALRVAEGWERKCGELRAKVEQMEKQEPVAFALYSGWARKAVYLSDIEACEQRDRRQLTADLGGSLEAYRVVPLYLAPGAKGE